VKRLVLGATAALALAAVGAAVITQQVWGMLPCPWCVLQRLIVLAIAAACLIGLALPRLGASLAALLAVCGLAAALWQHFVAASSASCELTLADRIMTATGLDGLYPDVFMAMSSCGDAKVDLFGLPYEAWSGGLFLLIGIAMVWLLTRAGGGSARGHRGRG
jgi:disulfide bond formation protein DsbB